MYSLESDRIKVRTARRRSWRRVATWEAEMPPSLSESPSEERQISGLDLLREGGSGQMHLLFLWRFKENFGIFQPGPCFPMCRVCL